MTVLIPVLIVFWLLLAALMLGLRLTPYPLRRRPAISPAPTPDPPSQQVRPSMGHAARNLRAPQVW